MYLVVEYPHSDVYEHWSAAVNRLSEPRLFNGIMYDDMLVRRGGLGYKLSVWTGDARLFITDRVDDELATTPSAGQGMGVMLQLGPKWLRVFGDFTSCDSLTQPVLELLRQFKLRNPEQFPIRLNRIDVALDIQGLHIANFSIDEWREGWVGRASGKQFYDDPRTGRLSGFAIGSSKGAIRFKAYDKVLESKKSGDFNFWCSVWNSDEFADLAITRFEWSIKPHNAKFEGMRYLSDYTFDGLKQILNYVTKKWGRLCVPQPGETNRSRWVTHLIWERIRRAIIEEWDIDHVGCAQREYHLDPDINPSYLSSVTGSVGGLMARVGLAKGYNGPASIAEALTTAEQESKPIAQKADEKWQVLAKLAGKDYYDGE